MNIIETGKIQKTNQMKMRYILNLAPKQNRILFIYCLLFAKTCVDFFLKSLNCYKFLFSFILAEFCLCELETSLFVRCKSFFFQKATKTLISFGKLYKQLN